MVAGRASPNDKNGVLGRYAQDKKKGAVELQDTGINGSFVRNGSQDPEVRPASGT